MACLNSLKGVYFNMCDANLAGVKEIYLTDDLANLQVSAVTSALTVTNISGATFYGYQIEKQQGYLTSTANFNDNGRLLYYTNEVRIAFGKLDKDKHLEFMALTHNPVKALVLDNNGIWHFLSYDAYLAANSGVAQTGQSFDDDNQYEVILSGQSAYPSFIVDEATAKAVIEEPTNPAQ